MKTQKKNIVFIATSLDGYIADKNEELDWLESISNPENIDLGFLTLLKEVDAIIMGRTTYEVVGGFGGEWPYSKHVFVLSNTLNSLPERLKEKVSLLSGTPQEILTQIHKKGFFRLYIDGGRTVQNFLQEDLIDELRITTIPILLGGGFSLFGELSKRQKYELITSKVYLNQVVQSHYKRSVY